MRVMIPAVFALTALCAGAAAQTRPKATMPDALAPFDQAYAASFYTFDACGDGIAGQLYRKALMARFAQCPFPAAVRDEFRQRTALQRRKSSAMIRDQIERTGGLPTRLEGMSMTCHEQQAGAAYRAFREKLERFAADNTPETVIPEPCGAETISPY